MITLHKESLHGLSDDVVFSMIKNSISKNKGKLNKVLLVPPDITRKNSEAGKITCMYYSLLKNRCEVHILPALGTHEEMSKEEIDEMYPSIPHNLFIKHNWRNDIVDLGIVPKEFVSKVSDG